MGRGLRRRIAQALEARLTPREAAGLQAGRGESLAAYEIYRRGLAEFRKYRKADNEAAITAFRAAIEKDSNYALAYAALSEAYSFKVDKLDAPLYWLESARQAAEYAVALDAQSPEAYGALGAAYLEKGWYRRARTALARALELNPNYAAPLGRLAAISKAGGDLAGAWEMARRAVALDPNDPYNYLRLGDVYFNLGEFEAGERWMRQGAARLNDPEKEGQIEIQIAHARRDYARIIELFRARRASNLAPLAMHFGDMPGRGPTGYYMAMAAWNLGDIPAVRAQIETATRMSDPDGVQHGRIQTGIAILRWREGRDAEMRQACRQLLEYFRGRVADGSEDPYDYFNLTIGAWLSGDAKAADEYLASALREGLLIGKPDETDMLPSALGENPRFAAAKEEIRQKIEANRGRIRELEKRYP